VGIFATFVPLLIGLASPKLLGRFRSPHTKVWLVAFSAGVIFWFFIDVMGDAVQLDINQGFGGGYIHVALALSFAIGVAVLFGLEKRFSRTRTMPSTAQHAQITSVAADITFAIAAVAALGIGFHALGEGMDIGASLPKALNILDAIGGAYPGVAYVLHKFLEGFVIGTFATVAGATTMRKFGILAALSGTPTIMGFFLGLPATLDSSYTFALGGAGAVYVEMKLVPVLARSGRFYVAILPLLLGFYAMYTAGLFHSVASG
jgi:zinc transporter ZupT